MSTPPDRLTAMTAMARQARWAEFVRASVELEPADLADVLAQLDEEERLEAVHALPPEVSAEALVEMPDEAHAEETLAALGPGRAADIVEELQDDDAADLLGELSPEERERILSDLEDRTDVEHLLRYDEETAGGLMTTHVVTVQDSDTAAAAINAIRQQAEDMEDFYQVFVVDHRRHLVGLLPLKDLVVNHPDRPVRDFMEDADIRVQPELDQEEVARLMARYNLPSVPVVDPAGRLLGRVTFDDVTDVVEAETTEDLLRFGGVSPDEVLGGRWTDAVRSRLPWLGVNLLTAFTAAAVVLLFEATIAKLSLLAVFMPVIAGMGGNAGTQALAVTVRRLALGNIPRDQSLRVVGKEMLVGLTNGVAAALLAGLAAGLIQDLRFGLVVGTAMVGNLFVAGFAGAVVPITLERLKIDPAVASSIFVTTFTDMCGFFLLLGLAARVLL